MSPGGEGERKTVSRGRTPEFCLSCNINMHAMMESRIVSNGIRLCNIMARATLERDNTIFLQLLSRSWKFLKISLLY